MNGQYVAIACAIATASSGRSTSQNGNMAQHTEFSPQVETTAAATMSAATAANVRIWRASFTAQAP